MAAIALALACSFAWQTPANATEPAQDEKLACAIGVQTYISGFRMMDVYRTLWETSFDPGRGHDRTLNEFFAFALCPPGWQGLLPEGVTRIDMGTPIIRSLHLPGKADIFRDTVAALLHPTGQSFTGHVGGHCQMLVLTALHKVTIEAPFPGGNPPGSADSPAWPGP